MNNPIGVAQCALQPLQDKGLKFIAEKEHISIRCPDCDMRTLPAICKPKDARDHLDCPFFNIDRFDLEQVFELVDSPAPRRLTSAGKEK